MGKEIKSEIRRINQLISNKRYKEAYNACNKLLLNFPENSTLQNLQSKIEKIVFKRNVASIKEDLKSLKPLWKEKNYKELVDKLKVLEKYVPGYRPVENQLYKAKKLYQKQVFQSRKDYFDKSIKLIENKISNKKYKEAITLIQQLLKNFPENNKCLLLLEKARNLYIDQQIRNNEKLLSSEKFDEIEEFLKNLQKINPESRRIKSLLNKISKREKISLEFARKEFAYKSFDNIITLYQKKKYEETVKALNEILEIEPDNLKALELRAKAKRKFNRQLTREVVDKIKKLQKKYKKEYKDNKSDFVRI